MGNSCNTLDLTIQHGAQGCSTINYVYQSVSWYGNDLIEQKYENLISEAQTKITIICLYPFIVEEGIIEELVSALRRGVK